MTTNSRNTRVYLFFILLLLSAGNLLALSEGDFIFTGFNADGEKGFSIVVLVEIPASSTIYFTDNEWNGSPIGSGGAFNSGEGTITWSTGGAAISVGTTVTFEGISFGGAKSASIGSINGNVNLEGDDEVLYAYEGSFNAPTTFVSAIANDTFTNGTITNTGLTSGTDAISLSGDDDVMVYSGTNNCNSKANCLADIANSSNWSGEGELEDDSGDSEFPDFPEDLVAFSTLLPIELVAFEVTGNTDGTALISWATATEIDNDFFSVERSDDARNWEVIAKVGGAGSSISLLTYHVTDPTPHDGLSYYRLKQTDFDGQFSYSPIKELSPQALLKSWSLYPNPAADFVSIEGLSGIAFRIFDHRGTDVTALAYVQRLGDSMELDIRSLSEGLYVIRSPLGSKLLIKL